MKVASALKVAIECIEDCRRRQYAFDRNVGVRLGPPYSPRHAQAIAGYDKMTAAIEVLKDMARRL